MMRTVSILILLFVSFLSMAQRPLHEWTFTGTDPLKDLSTGKRIDTLTYKCPVTLSKEADISFIRSKVPDCILPFSLFNNNTSQQFSLEIMFRGNDFFYTSFPAPLIRITYKFDYIQFSTTVLRNNKQQTEQLLIKLDGLGAPTYGSIADNHWRWD